MGQEVQGDLISDEFKGYIFKITGGNDKQGFPMKQGVLHSTRVKLLLSKNSSCYRPRRDGERKRKSVRGCIVSLDLAVLSLLILKQGESEIDGLTNITLPKRLGPKRANKIRKFYGLSKDDDVRQYVVKREIEKNGKKISKAPKIQRLITPQRLQRKRAMRNKIIQNAIKQKEKKVEFEKLLQNRLAEHKKQKSSVLKQK